jgi:hypothetical protein
VSVLGKLHLLRQSIDLKLFQIDNRLFMGQKPLKNLSTARSELCIDLTHIFNRQRQKLTVPVLLKLLNSRVKLFIVELKVFAVEGFRL